MISSVFSLEQLSFGMITGLAVLGAIQAIIVSLMIIALSTNKLEGMAVTKLSTLTLLGIPVSFFVHNDLQYAISFLPSFWVGKAMESNHYSYFLISLAVASVWLFILENKHTKKLAA